MTPLEQVFDRVAKRTESHVRLIVQAAGSGGYEAALSGAYTAASACGDTPEAAIEKAARAYLVGAKPMIKPLTIDWATGEQSDEPGEAQS